MYEQIIEIKDEKIYILNISKLIEEIAQCYNKNEKENIDDIENEIMNSIILYSTLRKELVNFLLKKGVKIEDYEWVLDDKDLKELRGE